MRRSGTDSPYRPTPNIGGCELANSQQTASFPHPANMTQHPMLRQDQSASTRLSICRNLARLLPHCRIRRCQPRTVAEGHGRVTRQRYQSDGPSAGPRAKPHPNWSGPPGMPVGCCCVGADTRESSLLFDTPTACLRPSGSEIKAKALSGEHPVAMGWLFRFAAASEWRFAAKREVAGTCEGGPAA
jgi:hypothetical protein